MPSAPKAPDPKEISFRRLEVRDLPLMYHWLNENPLVNDMFAHGRPVVYEEMAATYTARIRREKPTEPYLILCGGAPIGYIQTYLWRDYPEYSCHLNLREEAASLDLFIGEEDYLHEGLGRPILQAFLRQIVFADRSVASCVITPEVRNEGALRAYEKAGFRRLRLMDDHPDEEQPIMLMRIGREEIVPVPPEGCRQV